MAKKYFSSIILRFLLANLGRKRGSYLWGWGLSKCDFGTEHPFEKQASSLNLLSQILDFRGPKKHDFLKTICDIALKFSPCAYAPPSCVMNRNRCPWQPMHYYIEFFQSAFRKIML